MTLSTPIVPLKAPTDVSLDDLEAELNYLWQSYSDEEGTAATRATTFSFLVYEPDETQSLLTRLGYYSGPIDGIAGPRTENAILAAQKALGMAATGKADEALLTKLRQAIADQAPRAYSQDLSGAGVADAIAAANPCRIITLNPTVGEDTGVQAQVSAYCPVQKQHQSRLVCCEYIHLEGTAAALDRIGGVVTALMIPELPQFVWWKAALDAEYGLLQRLAQECDRIIIDSSAFTQPETELCQVGSLMAQGWTLADLNWNRLAPWQELAAEAFDPPERRSAIWEVDRVTIDYEKGNPTQALLYLGWLASRLQWTPTTYVHEGGDYDIRRITFTSADQKTIDAELAGIPVDVGEVPGDLISLKLTSTNLQADCCTVLCSETTGCMRMEAGGGAQACRIQQVTPLFDQKTEFLLGQQLQRGGEDHLYRESMALTHAILQCFQG